MALRQRGLSGRIASLPLSGLSFLFHPLVHMSRTIGPILTIYTSYDVFSPKDVAFGLVDIAPQLGGQIFTF